MLNIESTVRLYACAEKINASRNLTDAEKLVLFTEIQGCLLTTMPGCPESVRIVHASIERMGANERTRLAAKEQGRKAEGREEPSEVGAGRVEESPEAPEGPTEGVQEPTEDAGRVDSPKPDAKADHKRKGKGRR